MNRIDETWHRLREWTYGQTPSERLAAQILAHQGYSVDPSHPLGGPDGGRDAICTRGDRTWVMAVYFPRGDKSFGDIEGKFNSDLAKAREHAPHGLAFVTNQELRLGEREQLRNSCTELGLALDLFHLERIAHILDEPTMAQVRAQYLSIEPGPMPIAIELGIDGAARYFRDSRQACETYIRYNTDQALAEHAEEAERRRATPRPIYRFSIPGMPNPAPQPTQEELRTQLTTWQRLTRDGWAESERYLAAHAWPGLQFRIKNVGDVYLNNVQVIITIDGAQGLRWEHEEEFDADEFVSPIWPKRQDPWNHMASIRSVTRANSVSWRNTSDDTVEITLDRERLPPIPEWISEDDDLVLLAVDPTAGALTASWTVTAQGYGKPYEGPAKELPVLEVAHDSRRATSKP